MIPSRQSAAAIFHNYGNPFAAQLMEVMAPPPKQSADGEISLMRRRVGEPVRHSGERAVPGRDGKRDGADGSELGHGGEQPAGHAHPAGHVAPLATIPLLEPRIDGRSREHEQ